MTGFADRGWVWTSQPWEVVAKASSDRGGLTITWNWIVAVGVVVGLVAGLHQLISALRRRRLDSAEMRVLELAAQQLDAEKLAESVKAARQDAAELAQVRSALLEEVQRRVPEQARLVYLENRRNQLAVALRDQYKDYESVRREAELLAASGDPVSAELRASIKTLIEEDVRSSNGSERIVIVLLGVLVFFFITPIPPSQMVYGYFETVFLPDQLALSALAATLVAAALLCAVGWLGVIAFVKRRLRRSRLKTRVPSRRVWAFSVATAGLLALVAFAVGAFELHEINSVTRDIATRFEGAYECGDYPGDCSFLVSESFLNRTRGVAAAGFIVGTTMSGLLLAVGLERLSHRLRNRSPKR